VEERQQVRWGIDSIHRRTRTGEGLTRSKAGYLSFMSMLERFQSQIAGLALPPGRALAAVSGGPDSVALLDLLVRTKAVHGLEVVVGHVNHGIHPESHRVAERVRGLAESYGLPFEVGELGLGPSAGETLARTRRYAWLESVRVQLGAAIILTAHHGDDQIETVLMRVLAGSGPAGLAGMAASNGAVVRPLLPFRRAELAAYLEQRGLSAWLDPANSDTRHLRSWIRTELLPVVRDRVPQVERNLARLAAQAADDRVAWGAVLDALPELDLRARAGEISVAASVLADYDSALIQAVVLALARRAGCRLGPTRARRVLKLLRSSSSGARVPLGSNWIAELAFSRLHIHQVVSEPENQSWTMEGLRGSAAWGRWRFRWQPSPAPERQDRSGLSAWFRFPPLTVRAWVPGDRLKPLGGAGHRLIVRCLQEGGIPRSRRTSWPVLVRGNQILWVPGVCRSDDELPAGGMEALRVDAEYA
jgi:tRNA(Ile)-lysidine synthase